MHAKEALEELKRVRILLKNYGNKEKETNDEEKGILKENNKDAN